MNIYKISSECVSDALLGVLDDLLEAGEEELLGVGEGRGELHPALRYLLEGLVPFFHTLQRKILFMYIFPEEELRGLSPNFHIHVSVSDIYITRICRRHIFLQQNSQTDRGNIYCKSLTDT